MSGKRDWTPWMKKRRAPVLCALGAVLLCCLQSGASLPGKPLKLIFFFFLNGSLSNNPYKQHFITGLFCPFWRPHTSRWVYPPHNCLYISFSKHLEQGEACQAGTKYSGSVTQKGGVVRAWQQPLQFIWSEVSKRCSLNEMYLPGRAGTRKKRGIVCRVASISSQN